MASGTPVLTNLAGGIRETTKNGETCWAFTNNDFDSFKKKFDEIVFDEEERTKKLIYARKHAEDNFSHSKMISELIRILGKIKNKDDEQGPQVQR